MDKKKLSIPLYDRHFMTADLAKRITEQVEEYNSRVRNNASENNIITQAETVANACLGLYRPLEYARSAIVLVFALSKRNKNRMAWSLCSDAAFESGDLEICREIVIRSIKESSKSDVRNGNKAFIPLSLETADENVADILGMIMDELSANGDISEELSEKLLNDLAPLVDRWRALEVPKCLSEDAYDIVYEMIRLCFEHKAYHCAMRLSGLLYVADEPKEMPNLAKTNLLMGEVTFELGYMETAKQCFLFANEDTKGKCWEGVPEKYRALLEQETKLEITDEVLKKQEFLDENIANGCFKTYTSEEISSYFRGELEIEFTDLKKQARERKKLGEKAMATYEKYSQKGEKEKGISEAFKVFTEEAEVYPESAYFYFMQANLYLQNDELDKAYRCIQEAYKCKDGNKNGLILLTFAIILSKTDRQRLAECYVLRACIICGKDFVAGKLGDDAVNAIEEYL